MHFCKILDLLAACTVCGRNRDKGKDLAQAVVSYNMQLTKDRSLVSKRLRSGNDKKIMQNLEALCFSNTSRCKALS